VKEGKPMFGKKKETKSTTELIKDELPKDERLKAEITELSAIEGTERVDDEVHAAVSKAAKEDLRNYMLIDYGRCPVCHGSPAHFLFTVVCPTCGWFKRSAPAAGKSILTLRNGEKIECDHIHHGKPDGILCIRDGMVIAEVMRSETMKIEYAWSKEELEEAKETALKRRQGICSWCEKSLEESDEGGPFEDYVALGAMQERYSFCSEKCQRAFRKHYPPRVHRNCYETDCNACDLCIKRYDTHGFRRNILD